MESRGVLRGVMRGAGIRSIVKSFSYPPAIDLIFSGGTKLASKWFNVGGYGPHLSQSNALYQPDVVSDYYVFTNADGDYMADLESDTTPEPYNVVAVPDASSTETPGQGFPCTGLARNLQNGELLVGNHGGIDVHPDSTLYQSVVTLSSDGSTKIRENVLALGTNYSVQGVTYDLIRNTYWIEVSDIVGTNRTVRQYPMNASSDADLISSFAVDSDANGLTHNPNTDELYVLRGGSTTRTVKRYDPETGSYLGDLCTLPVSSTLDMLHYDPVNNILWYSKGANGANGIIQGYSVSGDFFGDDITVTNSLAIEGFLISTDGLTLEAVANDAYYHNGGSEINNISFYNFDLRQQVMKLRERLTELQVDIVMEYNTTPSGSKVIFAINDPVKEEGIAIYQGSASSTNISVIVYAGAAEAETLTLGAALTTKAHITIRADIKNKTVYLYQNGVLQDSASWVAAMTSVRYIGYGLGGNYDGSDVRWIDADIYKLKVHRKLLSSTEWNIIGQDWDDGESWTWNDQ